MKKNFKAVIVGNWGATVTCTLSKKKKMLLLKPYKVIVVQKLQKANCAACVHFCSCFCTATCRRKVDSLPNYFIDETWFMKYYGRQITPVLFTRCHYMKLNLQYGVLSVRQDYSDQPPCRTYIIQKGIQNKSLHNFLKV